MQSIQLAKTDLQQSRAPAVPEAAARWIARLFGCWHREMSRPFSHHGQAYRVCLNCGAQRNFNLAKWEMHGSFYYDRPTTHLRKAIRLVAGAN